jgi:hypothetical protein
MGYFLAESANELRKMSVTQISDWWKNFKIVKVDISD